MSVQIIESTGGPNNCNCGAIQTNRQLMRPEKNKCISNHEKVQKRANISGKAIFYIVFSGEKSLWNFKQCQSQQVKMKKYNNHCRESENENATIIIGGKVRAVSSKLWKETLVHGNTFFVNNLFSAKHSTLWFDCQLFTLIFFYFFKTSSTLVHRNIFCQQICYFNQDFEIQRFHVVFLNA